MIDYADNSSKGWKNISHKTKQAGGPGSKGQGAEEKITSNYYSYENDIYCIQPDGEMFMVVPVHTPSIGYELVNTDMAKKTVLSNSIGIPEHIAMALLFN
ncbi:MAG: hypothetical protein IJT59_05360 [Desulfovibrionaceae bacterium]|nr:hypothetical protein [Desulfovibrionaceae bacterium]